MRDRMDIHIHGSLGAQPRIVDEPLLRPFVSKGVRVPFGPGLVAAAQGTCGSPSIFPGELARPRGGLEPVVTAAVSPGHGLRRRALCPPDTTPRLPPRLS